MKPGPTRKSAQLEALHGFSGKRAESYARPDASDFVDEERWFRAWADHFETVHRECGTKSPTPAFWAAFKCRKMSVDIKARLLSGKEPQEAPPSKWAGLVANG